MISFWRYETDQSVDGAYCLSYPGAFVKLGRGQFHEGTKSGSMSDFSFGCNPVSTVLTGRGSRCRLRC